MVVEGVVCCWLSGNGRYDSGSRGYRLPQMSVSVEGVEQKSRPQRKRSKRCCVDLEVVNCLKRPEERIRDGEQQSDIYMVVAQ